VHVYPRLLRAALVTLVLGAATLAALGLAVASFARTADQAMPLAQRTFLPLSFVSGIFFPLDGAPGWVVHVAHAFPLYDIVNVFDTCFVPQTTGGGWSGHDLAAIAIWADCCHRGCPACHRRPPRPSSARARARREHSEPWPRTPCRRGAPSLLVSSA
jgi:hypothetical protein